LKKRRTIKELLEIDIDFLYENSVFKTDLIAEQSDTRNFLKFDLKSKFLGLFDQFQISMFDGKACHLEFQSLKQEPNKINKVIELILNEYGSDENNQNLADWNLNKYLSWWFKNNEHEKTYDIPFSTDDIYYGITIDGMENGITKFLFLNYSNIEANLNKKNWLQQKSKFKSTF